MESLDNVWMVHLHLNCALLLCELDSELWYTNFLLFNSLEYYVLIVFQAARQIDTCGLLLTDQIAYGHRLVQLFDLCLSKWLICQIDKLDSFNLRVKLRSALLSASDQLLAHAEDHAAQLAQPAHRLVVQLLSTDQTASVSFSCVVHAAVSFHWTRLIG